MRQFATSVESAALTRQREIVVSAIANIEQQRDKLIQRRAPYKADSVNYRALSVLIAECDESLRVLSRQAARHDEQARRFGGPQIEYRHVPAS